MITPATRLPTQTPPNEGRVSSYAEKIKTNFVEKLSISTYLPRLCAILNEFVPEQFTVTVQQLLEGVWSVRGAECGVGRGRARSERGKVRSGEEQSGVGGAERGVGGTERGVGAEELYPREAY